MLSIFIVAPVPQKAETVIGIATYLLGVLAHSAVGCGEGHIVNLDHNLLCITGPPGDNRDAALVRIGRGVFQYGPAVPGLSKGHSAPQGHTQCNNRQYSFLHLRLLSDRPEQITILYSRPSFLRKQESRSPAPDARWMPDQVRHDESAAAWLQPHVHRFDQIP